jgi:hypothetical protein
MLVSSSGTQTGSSHYFEDQPAGAAAAKLLTRDVAHRIAANIAKLPELLQHLASEEG